MKRSVYLWVGVAMLMAGCTGPGTGSSGASVERIYPPSVYAHRVSTPHVSVYWNCTQLPNDASRVEGVVQSSKGGRVKFVELELAGAGPRRGYVSSVKTALPDIILQTNQISPFAFELQKSGAERLDMFYQYEIDAAHGEEIQQRHMIRDVCSPTQHRVHAGGG